MVDRTDKEFEALADRLTDPTTVLPTPIKMSSGEEAAAAGQAFLLVEYGSAEALDAALRTAGLT